MCILKQSPLVDEAQTIPAATPCQESSGLKEDYRRYLLLNKEWFLVWFPRLLSKVSQKNNRKVGKDFFIQGSSLMKTKEKQELRSSNMLALLGLLVLSAVMIAVPWNRQTQDSRVHTAMQKAEVVGYQVVQIYRESIKVSVSADTKPQGRGLASIQEPSGFLQNLRNTGTMGVDPWGEPYHYRLLSSNKAGFMRVLVWSSGPNKKMETSELISEDVAQMGQPVYAGDDIGVVLSMSQN